MADTILDSAIDLAQAAALDAAADPREVGAHLGSSVAGDLLVTHLFGARVPGYRGWVWAVTVSRAPDDDAASVCEASLIPADDALLAPPWVPWSERVQPGDLEGAMVLPYIKEDGRLVPGYEQTDDEDADAVALWELGLGRPRVLGPEGREDTAGRWYRGSHGPQVTSALAATAQCASCGFFVAMSGSWRTMFGVCANEWSPSDGRVVSLDHGCGAHSETDVERQAGRWPADDPVIDTMASVPVDLYAPDEDEAPPVAEAEAVADAEPVADDVVEAKPETEVERAEEATGTE